MQQAYYGSDKKISSTKIGTQNGTVSQYAQDQTNKCWVFKY